MDARLRGVWPSGSHRGPDVAAARIVSSRCAVAHVQRSVPGAEYGAQPMTCTENGRTATIVWDGELCNADELRTALSFRAAAALKRTATRRSHSKATCASARPARKE